jgi:hypothetical protein
MFQATPEDNFGRNPCRKTAVRDEANFCCANPNSSNPHIASAAKNTKVGKWNFAAGSSNGSFPK